MRHRCPLHCIVPPFLLERLAASGDPDVRAWAVRNVALSAAARAQRRALSAFPRMAAIPSPDGGKDRLVYDMAGETAGLPGLLVRREGKKPVRDPAVNEAYDHSGATYDFYEKIFRRNSLDDRGMTLVSSVHYGERYDNAFWNGEQMAYGDGDGRIFVRFTKALDVVGHELTHGVVSHTANLDYENEPGALNEHFADVFGLLIKQWRRGETVGQADWLVGAEILRTTSTRKALRSFIAPGTAFVEDPDLGTDPQPGHMRDKYKGRDDEGGVHINSGIPNHAFYLAARDLGGRAWERAGRIWYAALLSLGSRASFHDAARATALQARAFFGAGSLALKAVLRAWTAVGVDPR